MNYPRIKPFKPIQAILWFSGCTALVALGCWLMYWAIDAGLMYWL